MIDVFKAKILLDSEWQALAGTRLCETMIRNQFVIRGMTAAHNDCISGTPEDIIGDYIEDNSTGLSYIRPIIDERIVGWVCYFENRDDVDTIMGWVKLKYQGTGDAE